MRLTKVLSIECSIEASTYFITIFDFIVSQLKDTIDFVNSTSQFSWKELGNDFIAIKKRIQFHFKLIEFILKIPQQS